MAKELRDNGITRQRFWGSPLPVWQCRKCKEITVVESRKELRNWRKPYPRGYTQAMDR
jgi:isoleucyl-tRNA synthetase